MRRLRGVKTVLIAAAVLAVFAVAWWEHLGFFAKGLLVVTNGISGWSDDIHELVAKDEDGEYHLTVEADVPEKDLAEAGLAEVSMEELVLSVYEPFAEEIPDVKVRTECIRTVRTHPSEDDIRAERDRLYTEKLEQRRDEAWDDALWSYWWDYYYWEQEYSAWQSEHEEWEQEVARIEEENQARRQKREEEAKKQEEVLLPISAEEADGPVALTIPTGKGKKKKKTDTAGSASVVTSPTAEEDIPFPPEPVEPWEPSYPSEWAVRNSVSLSTGDLEKIEDDLESYIAANTSEGQVSDWNEVLLGGEELREQLNELRTPWEVAYVLAMKSELMKDTNVSIAGDIAVSPYTLDRVARLLNRITYELQIDYWNEGFDGKDISAEEYETLLTYDDTYALKSYKNYAEYYIDYRDDPVVIDERSEILDEKGFRPQVLLKWSDGWAEKKYYSGIREDAVTEGQTFMFGQQSETRAYVSEMFESWSSELEFGESDLEQISEALEMLGEQGRKLGGRLKSVINAVY